jgi:hypothetical protein
MRIAPSDWTKALDHVNKSFFHAISPITVVELVSGVDKGGPNYFSQNKVALRKLRCGFGSHVHLPYTKYFTLREVFGKDAPYPPELEGDFDQKIDRVLNESSFGELSPVFASLAVRREYQFETARAQAKRIRSRGRAISRKKWAADMLVPLELENTPENLSLLDERLDACFYWDKLCHEKAMNKKCDLEKVAKMLYDMSQLNFLAAEDLMFVTRDMALIRAIAKSKQANRVMLWEKFLQRCKN